MKAKNIVNSAYLLLVMTVVSSCSDDVETQLGPPHPRQSRIPGLPGLPVSPFNYNNSSASNATIALGRVLFYDKALSGDNTTSCASCHKQSLSFSDNTPFSKGHGTVSTDRNAMAIQNLPMQSLLVPEGSTSTNPYGSVSSFLTVGGFFWDGRESFLPNMVLKPITNFNEMGNVKMSDVIQRISMEPYYAQLFKDAFPNNGNMTIDDKVGVALAGFVSSITVTATKYDRFSAGSAQLTASENNGLILFKTKYNCDGCHHIDETIQFSPRFANIGLDSIYDDPGLAQTTRTSGDEGKFKVPSLRNVEFTAPYMHDGRFATLEEVIKHYRDGIANHPNLHSHLKDQAGVPLRMDISDEQMHDLVAFLRTLSDRSILTDQKFSDPF